MKSKTVVSLNCWIISISIIISISFNVELLNYIYTWHISITVSTRDLPEKPIAHLVYLKALIEVSDIWPARWDQPDKGCNLAHWIAWPQCSFNFWLLELSTAWIFKREFLTFFCECFIIHITIADCFRSQYIENLWHSQYHIYMCLGITSSGSSAANSDFNAICLYFVQIVIIIYLMASLKP